MTQSDFLEIMNCNDPVELRRAVRCERCGGAIGSLDMPNGPLLMTGTCDCQAAAETGTADASRAGARASLPGVHIAFTVPGQPVAKGRAKFSRKGSFVRAYTPEKTANYEGLVAYSCAQAMGGMEPLAGPLSIVLTVGVQIPASWSKKRQAAAEAGDVRPTKKPDLDNIVKSICDGLNAVAYADDAQIVEMTVRKFYTHTPGVLVVLRVQDGEKA